MQAMTGGAASESILEPFLRDLRFERGSSTDTA
ncbi:MAG: Acyl-CoA dehydrogenase/oxidase domain protein, partial [Caballeronia sp.]|nr:Acyl-CoA dehydrogenase/oxidase domain protein [Caballeronia sp.]